MLTDRQQMLLRTLVESHVELGQPVGSKWLAERSEVRWSSSTIRYELAALEEAGFLNHPHTSAGRVPTDAGYRWYADTILHEGPLPAPAGVQFDVELSNMRREVDAAMRFTTTTLSQMTDLLAAVSAPPLHTATIKHIEVLLLQPQIALVVVITSSGTVTKRAFTFEQPVDAGLADWAASYLNERLAGTDLGALTLQGKLLLPELSKTERGFLEAIAPVFSDLPDTVEDTLYVDGTSRLLSGSNDVSEMNDLIRMLERRVTLLSVLRSALGESTVYLRIGAENQAPELHSAAVVAANYGLGHRTLGAVSVIGPVRMDYRNAILSVRAAAKALSSFVEEVYE
ncbi:MAG TPA: heat-inducible transcriptional repressor HrcA [Solirubrobacterales bacterium]|nr:heat-inducible transcriptional repressor HrcA [Solirubrobacterales bacterium]